MADTHFLLMERAKPMAAPLRGAAGDRKQRQMVARLTGGNHVTEPCCGVRRELLTQAEKFRAEISE